MQTAIISLLTTITTLWGVYNFLPLSVIESLDPSEQRFGSTITTIQGSDTLSASRSVINTNFANLNADKVEISALASTTSLPQLTTLAALATVGTITSGTWSGTAIAVAKGGTGTTSPSANQVILGNGASGLTNVSGWGTSGQLLTSSGSGLAPTWASASTDVNIQYIWGAYHSFPSLFATSASSTNATTTNLTVNGRSIFSGGVSIGTASTTAAGSIAISGLASTTNLTVSGACVGCPLTYTGSSTAATITTDMTFTGSIPTTANTGIITAIVTGTNTIRGNATITRAGAVTSYISSTGANYYNFTWSGADLVVDETDAGADDTIDFTAYWYK